MNRRTAFMLTGMALLGLAIAALPQPGFAQRDPWLGTWQLNPAKSKYSPGPPPKNITANIQGEGQNHKVTVTGIDAAGNPISAVFTRTYDGVPHRRLEGPGIGAAAFDAAALTRVDDHTIIISRTKAGKLVQTSTGVISLDGKTMTTTTTGINANGRQINDIAVYDKQ
jgi:hypothetical protein